MIVLSNTTAQTLEAGQSITFDKVVLHTGCGEGHRANTGSVKMRQNGIYEVTFNGNIAGPTAGSAVSLAMELSGEILPETTMTNTPSLSGAIGNVSATTAIKNCCGDYDRVTVTNIGTEALTVLANAMLFVKRIA